MKKAIFLILILLLACAKETPKVPPIKLLKGTTPSGAITTPDGYNLAYQYYEYKRGKPAVILLHMLGRTREDWNTVAVWLQQNGYNVLALDLRGHGLSSGNWEEFKAEDFNKMVDDLAAIKSVLKTKGADTKKLAIIGASIGANVALNYAAKDQDIRTVILLSPGLDYRGIKTSMTVKSIGKPFMIVVSKEDTYSAESSQELAKNNYAQLVLYEDAGHGTNMFIKNDLAPTILQWLKDHV